MSNQLIQIANRHSKENQITANYFVVLEREVTPKLKLILHFYQDNKNVRKKKNCNSVKT